MFKTLSEEKQREWKERIRKQESSDLSIEKWCLQNQIRTCQFHYWKTKLFPKPLQKSSFTELKRCPSNFVSIESSGISIRFTNDCDSELRRKILTLFVEHAC